MIRKELRELGWLQVQSEARIICGETTALTAKDENVHEHILRLACRNIILGSYRDAPDTERAGSA